MKMNSNILFATVHIPMTNKRPEKIKQLVFERVRVVFILRFSLRAGWLDFFFNRSGRINSFAPGDSISIYIVEVK